MTGPRIVSLLPSTTEIIHHLGLLENLVGRSHECDFPTEVTALPAVTSTRIDPGAPAADIDRDVRSLVEQALSPFLVDAEALRELAPDVILTQHQCEVCAISEKELSAALASWTGGKPTVLSTAPSRLRELYRDIHTIGEALDRRYEGEALAQSMRERIEVIATRAGSISPKPKILMLDWADPPMVGGLWMPELIRAAGGRPVLARIGEKAGEVDLGAIAAAKPDIVLVAPCGFALGRAVEEAEAIRARLAPGVRIVAADGNAYFNRPGPRLVDSLEILAEIVEPGAFNFSREGTGWREIGQAAEPDGP